jgi:hypothetical protein
VIQSILDIEHSVEILANLLAIIDANTIVVRTRVLAVQHHS